MGTGREELKKVKWKYLTKGNLKGPGEYMLAKKEHKIQNQRKRNCSPFELQCNRKTHKQ